METTIMHQLGTEIAAKATSKTDIAKLVKAGGYGVNSIFITAAAVAKFDENNKGLHVQLFRSNKDELWVNVNRGTATKPSSSRSAKIFNCKLTSLQEYSFMLSVEFFGKLLPACDKAAESMTPGVASSSWITLH